MILIFGHDKTVLDWANKKFDCPIRECQAAVGVIDGNGVLKGAAIFHNFNGANIEASYYGPGSATARIALGLMRFIFESLPITRVTAITQRGNKVMAKHLPRFGFKFEGILRRYYGKVKRLDGVLFGLTREDAMAFLERRGEK